MNGPTRTTVNPATQTLRRLLKFAAHGPVPEELAVASSESGDHVGSDDRAKNVSPLWPPDERLAASHPAVADLWRIEHSIGQRLLVNNRDKDVAETTPPDPVVELETWCQRWLSDDGLLRDAPTSSFRVLPGLIRCRLALDHEKLPSEITRSLEQVTEASAALATPLGWFHDETTLPLSPEFRGMCRALLVMPELASLLDAVRLLAGIPRKRTRGSHALPPFESDDGRFAAARGGSQPDDPYFAIEFHQPHAPWLFAVGQSPVVSGHWELKLSADHRPVSIPRQPWENTCWYTDEEGTYLELRLLVGQGLLLERQVYFNHVRRVLWLADTVKSSRKEALTLEWEWQLEPKWNCTTDGRSVVGTLDRSSLALRIIPVCFRGTSRTCSGSMLSGTNKPADDGIVAAVEQPGKIRWSSSGFGDRHVAAAVIRWQPVGPPEPPPVCRRLNITSDRRIVETDEAVAVVVPAGRDQLVFFRSLRQKGRYAFLGYQSFQETVIGRFNETGDIEEWLIVD